MQSTYANQAAGYVVGKLGSGILSAERLRPLFQRSHTSNLLVVLSPEDLLATN